MTGTECFARLEPDVQQQFIINLQRAKGLSRSMEFMNRDFGMMCDFIDKGFTWRSTTEGHDYWQSIYNSYLPINNYKTQPYKDETDEDN